MAKKTVADAAKAKAAKQKKIAIVLSVVLLGAVYYAYSTMSSLGGGGAQPQPAPAAAASTTPATPAPTPAPGSTAAPTLSGAPAAAAPAATPAATPTDTTTTQLVAAARPSADAGQLQSFSLFESKDPFASGGPKEGATGGGSSSSSSGGGKSAKGSGTTASLSSAVISVNGSASSVALGSDFPITTDPTTSSIFHLVALTAKTAKVSVVGGSYASGADTLTLTVNVPVTLVNTADGKRYTLELYPPGTAVPGASGSSG